MWISNLRVNMEEIKHISVDGKTLRGSFTESQNNSGIHIVEAFTSDLRLVLAQTRAPYKGYGENEALFEMLSSLP